MRRKVRFTRTPFDLLSGIFISTCQMGTSVNWIRISNGLHDSFSTNAIRAVSVCGDFFVCAFRCENTGFSQFFDSKHAVLKKIRFFRRSPV